MRLGVCNIKGGSSKTCTAIHLADALTDHGKVLFVDMDPQADATDYFLPDASLEELSRGNALSLCRGESTLKESIRQGHIDLVPAVIDLAGLSADVMRSAGILRRLEKVLAKTEYDYTIIDTPGALCAELTCSLVASDVVLIPVSPSKWAVRAVSIILSEIQSAAGIRGKRPPVYIVPAMFGKSERDQTILSMLSGIHGVKKVLPAIPKSAMIQNKTENGQRLKRDSAPGIAFSELAGAVRKL